MAGAAGSKLKHAFATLATPNCSATATRPCDSDGDQVPDTMERGIDLPNDGEGALCVGPKYGFGAGIASVPDAPLLS